MTPAFTGVGVVVPARDEEARIVRCLAGVLAALERLPGSVDRAVCVVLDRCTDATAALAARVAADTHVPVDLVVNNWPTTVGVLRHRGMLQVLDRLARNPPDRTWLLSTDADTVAEPGWVLDHLRHAQAGAHAVAGLADLDDERLLSPPARRAYARLLAAGHRSDGHDHVYGANLGVRADAYLAAGGFPSLSHGEDHGLSARLRATGHRVVTATDVRVATSARLRGRATGGLADLLSSLHEDREPDVLPGSGPAAEQPA